ncbi:cytochrome P450 4C1-like isoform X2 [Anopheles funestus]|uniref:cytochrome P450 4C1-like isoform X2 n=1 Tax=Anopheles funestus TaxID=62324 RepID=UPI0020C73008|nr:cytochrome P450 4C1-like isoform X2 [Anopheles funestus]
MAVQMLLIYVTVSLALATLLCIRWKRRKLYAAASTMDGPPCLPLLGHAYLIFGKRNGEYIIQVFDRYAPRYTSPIGIWLGPKLIVAFKDNPDYFQTVMNSPHLLNKMDQYNFFRAENGLLTAPAHVWKNERKLLNRSFSPLMLSSFVDTFNEKDFILVENLRKFVGNGEINLQIYISKCTIDALFGNAFGRDLNTQGHDGADEYLRCLDTFLSLVFKRVLHLERYLESIYRLTTDYKVETNCVNIIRNMSLDLMKKVKENSKPFNDIAHEETYGSKPVFNFADSLSNLAKHNPSLTEDHIKDHIDTMIMAGHDTTANTISKMLLMMAMHPEVQELVYQEVMSVCPDRTRPVTTEEANNLVYTEMVCKETMRLFPIAPVIGRKCVADVKLDDKHTIPAGCSVALGIFQIHRDPSIWGPDSEKFNPDHFLPEKVAERHPYAYLPFSGGPRNCIGIRYAWLSMKIMIAHLVRNYRFKTTLKMEDLLLKFAIVLRITNGCLVTIEDRN